MGKLITDTPQWCPWSPKPCAQQTTQHVHMYTTWSREVVRPPCNAPLQITYVLHPQYIIRTILELYGTLPIPVKIPSISQSDAVIHAAV